MKARIENGKIIVYENIPEQFVGVLGNTVGGYDKLPDEIHRLDGFYELVIPEYNNVTQYLGDIYFDNDNFIYSIQNRTFNIEREREKKLSELKIEAQSKFSSTDWYYIRNFRNGKSVPFEVEEQSRLLYQLIDQIEQDINLLDNAEDIINYQINLDII